MEQLDYGIPESKNAFGGHGANGESKALTLETLYFLVDNITVSVIFIPFPTKIVPRNCENIHRKVSPDQI